jgi:hypothetical protein
MLKPFLPIAIFGSFLVVASVIGFSLWQILFGIEKINDSTKDAAATQTEQQSAHKQFGGSGLPPSYSNPTEEAVAEYTKWLAVFTAFLVLATIGLFVSGERMAKISKFSADAANRSAEIAERALIAGQRAFVSVSFEPSAGKSVETNKITTWNFTPIWWNSGDTPTRNMQNHINIKLFDGSLPNDWGFPDLWAANIAVEDRLPVPLGRAPKGTVRGQAVGVSVDQMKEVIAGTKRLYMWGWASYNDVFPRTMLHVTRFAVQIVAGGDPTDNGKTSVIFHFARKYNCSDEECEHQGYPASWTPPEMSQ